MKKIYILIFTICFGATSCSDWLDINYNPNTPMDVPAELVLPQTELALAGTYGGVLHNMGSFFVQYFDQGVGASNYRPYSRFDVLPTNSSRIYLNLYSNCLINAEYVRTESSASGDWGNYLAATVIKAFAYQILVDCFGETPYTEALLGAANTQPHFDEGQAIYDGILAELEQALGVITNTSKVTDNNLLFGKNSTAKWIQFAKALRLKLLMRQANINGGNVKDKVMALISEGGLPVEDIKFTCWKDETGKSNPWYEDAGRFGKKNDHMGSHAYISTMVDALDPRLDATFDKSSTTKLHRGGIPGYEYNLTNDPKTKFSTPKFDAVAPVYMVTKVEINLWLAEAEYRWGSKVAAKSYYEKAIDASFAMYGLDEAQTFYVQGGKYAWIEADGLKLIAMQKWISLAGVNGFEAWCEIRRMGYPTFNAALGAEVANDLTLYTSGTLISPVNVATAIGGKQMLNRLYYAQTSVDKNPNAPAQKSPTTKVFWQE